MGRRAKPYTKDGWYCTSIGGTPHQKLCRISEGIKTAEIQLARLIVENDELPKSIRKNAVPTVAEAYDSFLDACATETSIGTFKYYQSNLKNFYEMFHDRQVKSLTFDDGIEYKKSLINPKMGLGSTSVNCRIQAARRLLTWCSQPSRRSKYLLTMNPFSELKRLPYKGRERLMTDEEFETVISYLKKANEQHVKGGGVDVYERFALMRYTTMRPQELRCIRWEYIRWDEHKVIFPAEVVKIRKRRDVTLIDAAEKLLRERAERLKANGNDVTAGYVFFRPRKSKFSGLKKDANIKTDIMVTAAGLASQWRRGMEACAKKKLIELRTEDGTLVPYSLRHKRITELVLEEHLFPVLMAEAGHLNPKTTMKYVHLASNETAKRIRNADEEKKTKSEEQKMKVRKVRINYEYSGKIKKELPDVAARVSEGVHHRTQSGETDKQFLERIANEIRHEFLSEAENATGTEGFSFSATFAD